MRRVGVLLLLLAGACSVDTTAPGGGIQGFNVTSNGSANGTFVGDSVQLNVVAIDAYGDPIASTITYMSTNTSVATVTTTGLIVGVGPGTTNIVISAGGASESAALAIDGNVTQTVQLAPLLPTVPLGTQLQVTYTVLTTLGNPARNKSVTWASNDTTKVLVDNTGLVTAHAVTTGVPVCATVTDGSGVTGCTTIVVQ